MPPSIAQSVIDAANAYGVDPRLALEVAIQESALDPSARSSVGAVGVFQLMPATAAQYGVVDRTDPAQNIEAGVRHLSYLLGRYGDPRLALAAYNWGEGNLDRALERYGDSWYSHAPAETQNFVPAILARVQSEYTVTPAVVLDPVLLQENQPGMDMFGEQTIGRTVLIVAGIILLLFFGVGSDLYSRTRAYD